MATTVFYYRTWCITEQAYVYSWGTEPPTKCINNTEHEIDINSIAVVSEVDSQDVNVVSTVRTEIQETSFPDFTGYSYFADSCHGVAIAGTTTYFYMSFNQKIRIHGGGFQVGANAVHGDYVTCDMTYGQGGPVVGQMVNKMYVWPQRVWEKMLDDSKEIPVGICLRMGYVSVGTADVDFVGWYDLRRTPSA